VTKPAFIPSWWRAAVAYAIVILFYCLLSSSRQETNPGDRLLPSLPQIGAEAVESATQGSRGGGLWSDTWPSLRRYFLGLGAAALLSAGLVLAGAWSAGVTGFFRPLLLVLAKVPPVLFLPMMLLWAGVNDWSKWLFLLLAITPPLYLSLMSALGEQRIRLATLNQSLTLPRWQQAVFVEAPLLWPEFLTALQAQIGPAWLFLLTAETAGAAQGLGYRIFVVQRYLAMDTIIVYATWITLLSITCHWLLSVLRRAIPWTPA